MLAPRICLVSWYHMSLEYVLLFLVRGLLSIFSFQAALGFEGRISFCAAPVSLLLFVNFV